MERKAGVGTVKLVDDLRAIKCQSTACTKHTTITTLSRGHVLIGPGTRVKTITFRKARQKVEIAQKVVL